MNKELLKAIILELRGNNERSFQEISDILECKYGIKRSRQAICGMYNRAISDKAISKNTDKIIAPNDILHYHAIGVSISRILEILKADGMEVTLSSIKDIVDRNEDKKEFIKNTLEDKAYKLINKGFSYEEIKIALAYKVEAPSEQALNKLMQEATLRILREQEIKTLRKILNLTQDEKLIKSILQIDRRGSIKFKDISKIDTEG